MARPSTPGVCYRRWRTVAFDGCSSLKASDLPRIRALLGKVRHPWGMSGYPSLRLTVLCETGTRGLLGAVFGPSENGETVQATRLLPPLTPQMLLLADRAFDGDDFLGAVARTGSQFLVRLCAHRRPAVLPVLRDGSYLTRFKGLRVRIINADITLTTSSGQRIAGRYRLATTLKDPCRDPAEVLVRRYHERWEIESAFYSLRHTLLTGRVLRSQEPRGLEQKVWALLTLQALRMAMVDTVESVPGADPDRTSFTVALQAARDQLIRADHVLPNPSDRITTGISAAVLSALLPPRRSRTRACKVKCPTSRYPANPTSDHPLTSQNVTGLAIETLTHSTSSAAGGRSGQRNRVLQHMRTAPHRSWHARELATALDFTHYDSLCLQLGRWTREGLLEKIANATYRLAPDCLPPQPSPSECP
ncbi:transposase [Streptomyces sp. NPDC003328]